MIYAELNDASALERLDVALCEARKQHRPRENYTG